MTTGDWAYLLLAFVIFSVSVAIVRRQFVSLAKKTNVPKAIKGRFGGVFGGSGGQGAGNNGNDDDDERRDEQLIAGGDDESGRKKVTYTSQDKSNFAAGLQYLQSSVGKVMGTKKAKDSDEETGDPCEYEVLDACNNEKDRAINLEA